MGESVLRVRNPPYTAKRQVYGLAAFIFVAELDIQATGFALPVLTLQPIVENAVRHSVTGRVEGGKIIIRSREEPDHWRVWVEDNGVGFDPECAKNDGRPHIGIGNIKSRLAAMRGGTLAAQSETGVGTAAVISIPKAAEHRRHTPSPLYPTATP